MKLIELHWDEDQKYSLNVDYIAAVKPRTYSGCEIYMVGDALGEQWNCNESYEEVLRLIKEG